MSQMYKCDGCNETILPKKARIHCEDCVGNHNICANCYVVGNYTKRHVEGHTTLLNDHSGWMPKPPPVPPRRPVPGQTQSFQGQPPLPPTQSYPPQPIPQTYPAQPIPGQYGAAVPPQQYTAVPPGQYGVPSPAQQHMNSPPPSQQYGTPPPPQQYSSIQPPQSYRHSMPPQAFNAAPSPQQYTNPSPVSQQPQAPPPSEMPSTQPYMTSSPIIRKPSASTSSGTPPPVAQQSQAPLPSGTPPIQQHATPPPASQQSQPAPSGGTPLPGQQWAPPPPPPGGPPPNAFPAGPAAPEPAIPTTAQPAAPAQPATTSGWQPFAYGSKPSATFVAFLEAVFACLDTDKDGMLTPEQYSAFLDVQGYGPDEDVWKKNHKDNGPYTADDIADFELKTTYENFSIQHKLVTRPNPKKSDYMDNLVKSLPFDAGLGKLMASSMGQKSFSNGLMPMLTLPGFIEITVIETLADPSPGWIRLNRIAQHYNIWREWGDIPRSMVPDAPPADLMARIAIITKQSQAKAQTMINNAQIEAQIKAQGQEAALRLFDPPGTRYVYRY
ncbi:hypothetical protein BGZ60DRAFT_401015 [Tricladium varicosporioides]|nr:hypothetical protein BGZ60DRAFT_401015 [Hymenoscyphus varicosporioides]